MSLPRDCQGKVLKFSYFCFLTRFEPWRETCSYSQHMFSALFQPRFFTSSAPRQHESTEWPRNTVVFPFVHNFQGGTFPECSETTTWTRVGYSNRNLEMNLSLISFSFFRKRPLIFSSHQSHFSNFFFCYKFHNASPPENLALHLGTWPVTTGLPTLLSV